MKTIIIILISLMTISTMGNTTEVATIDSQKKIEKLLQKTIDFPDFAKKEKVEGIVLVNFTVNSDGTLNVNLTNESNEELKKYVVNKLNQIKLNPENITEGQSFNVKFEFKIEK
jgi:outer membrane biosynthesis protein TonB